MLAPAWVRERDHTHAAASAHRRGAQCPSGRTEPRDRDDDRQPTLRMERGQIVLAGRPDEFLAHPGVRAAHLGKGYDLLG